MVEASLQKGELQEGELQEGKRYRSEKTAENQSNRRVLQKSMQYLSTAPQY
ncbi:MAG: hypothetical protein RLZZ227_320 [Pseudomonadota bacterium]